MESVHDNISPAKTRLLNIVLMVMIIALIVLVPIWVFIGLANPRAILFIVMVVPTLLFLPALVFMSAITPPVTLTPDGIAIRPYVWRKRFVKWEGVELAKPYPLLPGAETEVFRRAMVGRKKYRAAEGWMLIIPELPLPYRVAGFFAGVNGKPVIAFTNRSHQDYDTLVKQVLARCPSPEQPASQSKPKAKKS